MPLSRAPSRAEKVQEDPLRSSSPASQRRSSGAVVNDVPPLDTEKIIDSDNSPIESDSSGGEPEFKEGGYGW